MALQFRLQEGKRGRVEICQGKSFCPETARTFRNSDVMISEFVDRLGSQACSSLKGYDLPVVYDDFVSMDKLCYRVQITRIYYAQT